MYDNGLLETLRNVMAETKANDVSVKLDISGMVVIGVEWAFGDYRASFEHAFTVEEIQLERANFELGILGPDKASYLGRFVHETKEQRKKLIDKYCLKCGREFSDMGWCHYCDNNGSEQKKGEL